MKTSNNQILNKLIDVFLIKMLIGEGMLFHSN